jgi:hypothetical protein
MDKPTNTIDILSLAPQDIISKTWAENDFGQFIGVLADGGAQLVHQAIRIGDTALKQLETEENTEAYFTTFSWPERMKAFLILWRDVLFQMGKTHIGVIDGFFTVEELQQLKTDSKETLLQAAEDLLQFTTSKGQHQHLKSDNLHRQIRRWKLQKNPWLVYKSQFEQLAVQYEGLTKSCHKLKNTLKVFHQIYAAIQQTCTSCESELASFASVAKKSIDYIESNINSKPGRVVAFLEEIEAEIVVISHLDAFLETFELKINELPGNMDIPIATEQGMLQMRDVNFQRSARQWLESEALPLLYESWEVTENANNGIQVALVNVRNRAIIIANEAREGKPVELGEEDICHPLKSFITGMVSYQENLSLQRNTIADRLAKHFKVYHVYNLASSFLALPLQSTINQLRFTQNVVWSTVNKWVSNLSGAVRKLIASVEKEEALSSAEKITRFVQTRSKDAWQNEQYSSIFLTKGYIGESFWVGRANEIQRAASLINQWESGFRGALCLTGQRFSGKTVFGELIAHRFFAEHIVRIHPNTTIKLGGRKFPPSYSLEEVLAFTRKHSLNQRALIWIDDLELWSNAEYTLGQNIRALKKAIDSHSNQAFFMVSMGNSLKAHLNKTHDIHRIFQAEINLDRMSVEEIRQAILIRHGATHKVLVDQAGHEISPNAYRKLTAKVYRLAEGNIGESLNLWSYNIQRFEGEKVVHEVGPLYPLPDFIQPDIAVVLSAIIMEKRTNEYRLRKLFGPAFTDKYRSILQRLLSTGLIVRQLDGWVELNEVAANEVGRMLEKKKYLNYYH